MPRMAPPELTSMSVQTTVTPPVADLAPRPRKRRTGTGDSIFRALTAGAVALVLLVLGAAALSMLYGGMPAFARFGWRFIYSTAWDPVRKDFGAAVPIYGTLVTSVIAMIIAVPISFGIAVFLNEACPMRLRKPIAAAIEPPGGNTEHHLRHVGTVRICADHVRHC